MASIYCIVIAAFISVTVVSGGYPPQKTSVVCENGHAKLECPAGKMIHVTYAMYGRTERKTCSIPDGEVGCIAHHSEDVASHQCDGKQSCSIFASNDVFGDPCHGTFKYLKVNYVCKPCPHHDEEKEEESNDKADAEREDEEEKEEDQPENGADAEADGEQIKDKENTNAAADERDV